MSQLTVEDVKPYSEDVARALVVEAKAREILDEDKIIPTDEAKLFELSDKLVELSLDEWYRSTPAELRGQIGDDVKALLGLVGVFPDGEDLMRADPTAMFSPVDSEPPEGSLVSQEESEPGVMEEPWDGYDDDIVVNILKKLHAYREDGELDDEAVEYVYNYETNYKCRKGILEFLKPSESAAEGASELDAQFDDAIAKDEDNESTERADSHGDYSADRDPVPASPAVEEHHLAGVQEASHFLENFKRERLPEPEQPKFAEDPQLPGNLSDLSDANLQQLYMDFGACLSRASWLLGLAQAEEARLERIAKRERAKAVLRYKELKPEQVRSATVDQDDEVVRWEDAHNAAEQDVKGYTRLASAYQGNVDRLSRIMAFRLAESERSKA